MKQQEEMSRATRAPAAGHQVYADKSFRAESKGKDAPEEEQAHSYERDGLSSPDLEVSEGLQAESRRALEEDDYKALEELSRKRLAIVPTSLMAQKNLAQVRFLGPSLPISQVATFSLFLPRRAPRRRLSFGDRRTAWMRGVSKRRRDCS